MAFDGVLRLTDPVRAVAPRLLGREAYVAEHLPYFAAVRDDVLITGQGDLMATLALDGFDPVTVEPARLRETARAVAMVISQSGASFGVYVHRIGLPQALAMPPVPGDGFAAELDARWQAEIAGRRLRRQRAYLTVLRRPDPGARVPLFNALARATYLTDRETRIDELNDVVGFFAAALHAAHPRRLDRSGLEWAGFLNALSSGVFAPPPLAPGSSRWPAGSARIA